MEHLKANPCAKKKILIVDDDWSSLVIAAKILETEGCTVQLAEQACEAITALKNENYDLVVLDWSMPQVGGDKTLEALDFLLSKESDKMDSIPFVVYTGQDPQHVSLPHTHRFRLIDFWSKTDPSFGWHKRARSLVQRLQRQSV